jgi:hypothetical protein
MNIVKEIGAYAVLASLAACVVSAAIVAATFTGGIAGFPAGAIAAALTFLAFRRLTGRVVAAAVDSL